MSPTVPEGYGEVTITKHADGHLTVDQDPPTYVAFSADLIDQLREGLSPWCSIELQGGCEVVVMHVSPVELRYRLTGEVDLADGLVGERVDEAGQPWTS